MVEPVEGPLRILFLRSDVALAGPGITALRLAAALKTLGHCVRLATSGGEMAPQFEEAGVPVDIVPELALDSRSVLSTLRGMWRVRKLVNQHRIDVIHSFNAHAAVMGEASRRTTRSRLVHTVLGTGKERMNRLHRATIVAVSGDTRERLLSAGIADNRMVVIPPFSIGEDYLLRGSQKDAVLNERAARQFCRFVNVAMFTGGKGQEQLIERFAAYAAQFGLRFELVLVGDGPSLATCVRLAEDLGIAAQVRFEGAQRDVRPFLDSADCFVHHAAFETFGMVMVEAGARMLPTIAADVGGIGDIVEHGTTGYLVPFADKEQFIARVKEIACDRDLRLQLGAAAQRRIEERFLKATILPRYLEAYAAT
jgi:glycosyltransferase involved in cell wall biosynthesis